MPDQSAAGVLTHRPCEPEPVEAPVAGPLHRQCGVEDRDSVVVLPHVELPANWTALTGAGEMAVAPGESGMLMLSVAVPSRAAAGVYPVRVVVTTTQDPQGVMDSVIVRVPPRRGVEVALQDRPGFVVSGRSYQTTFVVRNRGNAPGAIRVSARSRMRS